MGDIGVDQIFLLAWLQIRCVYIKGYEDINESQMDNIPLTPQVVLTNPGTPLCTQSPPPPLPPRAGKQEHIESSSCPDLKLATLKFANETNDDINSSYEYVSNPVKAKRKPTSNGCNKRETQHNGHHSSVRDGTEGKEVLEGEKCRKQHDMCMANDETGDAANEIHCNYQGNASFESACTNPNIGTCGLTDRPIPGQRSCDTCSKLTGRVNDGLLYCGGKSAANEAKGGNMEKVSGAMPEKDSYQKPVPESMSLVSAPRGYKKPIKETIKPRVLRRQYSNSDRVLQQTMEHSKRKSQDHGGYQNLMKDNYGNHEYEKLNRQTMEPSGYMLSVKCKHATI